MATQLGLRQKEIENDGSLSSPLSPCEREHVEPDAGSSAEVKGPLRFIFGICAAAIRDEASKYLIFSSALFRRKSYKTDKVHRLRFSPSRTALKLHCRLQCIEGRNPAVAKRFKKGRRMSHVYRLKEPVLHRGQGPQGRVQVEEPKIYTIIQRMPSRQMDVLDTASSQRR